jgi:hypothetical protein
MFLILPSGSLKACGMGQVAVSAPLTADPPMFPPPR